MCLLDSFTVCWSPVSEQKVRGSLFHQTGDYQMREKIIMVCIGFMIGYLSSLIAPQNLLFPLFCIASGSVVGLSIGKALYSTNNKS
jgi:hypothetical protein